MSMLNPMLSRALLDESHLSSSLTVCSEVEDHDVYGFVFDQLEHLELCVCEDDSLNLLAQFLKDSPNLRVLDISIIIILI